MNENTPLLNNNSSSNSSSDANNYNTDPEQLQQLQQDRHKRGVFIGDYFIFSKPSDYAITYKSLSAKNITKDIVKKTNDFILEKFNENLMSYVKRRIWVFIDTPRTIDDNAEVLFRYASQFEDGIEKYFIIPDESYKILFDVAI